MSFENVKKLYGIMKDDFGYDMPDFETFHFDIQKPENVKTAYDIIGSKYDVPDMETFARDIYSDEEERVAKTPMTPAEGIAASANVMRGYATTFTVLNWLLKTGQSLYPWQEEPEDTFLKKIADTYTAAADEYKDQMYQGQDSMSKIATQIIAGGSQMFGELPMYATGASLFPKLGMAITMAASRAAEADATGGNELVEGAKGFAVGHAMHVAMAATKMIPIRGALGWLTRKAAGASMLSSPEIISQAQKPQEERDFSGAASNAILALFMTPGRGQPPKRNAAGEVIAPSPFASVRAKERFKTFLDDAFITEPINDFGLTMKHWYNARFGKESPALKDVIGDKFVSGPTARFDTAKKFANSIEVTPENSKPLSPAEEVIAETTLGKTIMGELNGIEPPSKRFAAIREIWKKFNALFDSDATIFDRVYNAAERLGARMRWLEPEEVKILRSGRSYSEKKEIWTMPNPTMMSHELGHVVLINELKLGAVIRRNKKTGAIREDLGDRTSLKSLNLDKKELQNVYDSVTNELNPLWEKLYGKKLERRHNYAVDSERGIAERMADFIGLYIRNPEQARAIAPKLADKFGARLEEILKPVERVTTPQEVLGRMAKEQTKVETEPVGDPSESVFEVYHAGDIPKSFKDTPIHFGTRLAAEERRGNRLEYEDIDDIPITKHEIRGRFKRIDEVGGDPKAWHDEMIKAKKEGYTGLVYKNMFEELPDVDSYVIFDSSQLKTSPEKIGLMPKHRGNLSELPQDIREVIYKNNLRYEPKQLVPGEESLVQFSITVPGKESTLAIPESKLTPKYLQQKIDEKMAEYARGASEVPTEFANSTLARRLFGTAKGKGIDKISLITAVKQLTGVDKMKFVGDANDPNVLTERDLSELLSRMKEIDRGWTQSEKLHYMLTGNRPIPEMDAKIHLLMSMRESPMAGALRAVNEKFFRSIGTSLQKAGPVGREIYNRIIAVNKYKFNESAETLHKIHLAFKRFTTDDWRRFVLAVDSGKQELVDALPDRIRAAYRVYNDNLVAVDGLIKTLGLRTRRADGRSVPYEGKKGPYFPHMFEWTELRSKGRRRAFIQNVMKRKGVTEAEANKMLNDLISHRSQKLAGNIEYSRELDTDGWLGDPNAPHFSGARAKEAIDRYFIQAYTRMAEARYYDRYGKNIDPNHTSLSELIMSDPDVVKQARLGNLVKAFRGLNPADEERTLLAALRNLNVIEMLGLTAIPNFFQTAVTLPSKAFTFGFSRGVRILADGLKEAITNPNFARYDVGVSMMETIKNMTGVSGRGLTGRITPKFLKLYGMTATETVNNIVSASMGKPFIKEAMAIANGESPSSIFGIRYRKMPSARLRKLAIEELRKFGVSEDSIKSGKLTDSDITGAALRMTRMTQFGGGPEDFPLFYSTEWGKTLTQFKKFSFGMTKLMYNEVAKPAMHGNFAPLIGTMIGGIVSGEAINLIKQQIILGKDRDKNVIKRLAEDITAVGILGTFMDVIQSATAGNVIKAMAGPTLGELASTMELLSRGDIYEIIRRRIPIVRSTGALKKKKDEAGW